MSPAKIVRIVGLIVVLVAALIPAIPYTAIALAILGLLVGHYVNADNRPGLFLMVIALVSGVAEALGPIPVIGMYLTAILTSLGALLSAAAVMVTNPAIMPLMTDTTFGRPVTHHDNPNAARPPAALANVVLTNTRGMF